MRVRFVGAQFIARSLGSSIIKARGAQEIDMSPRWGCGAFFLTFFRVRQWFVPKKEGEGNATLRRYSNIHNTLTTPETSPFREIREIRVIRDSDNNETVCRPAGA